MMISYLLLLLSFLFRYLHRHPPLILINSLPSATIPLAHVALAITITLILDCCSPIRTPQFIHSHNLLQISSLKVSILIQSVLALEHLLLIPLTFS